MGIQQLTTARSGWFLGALLTGLGAGIGFGQTNVPGSLDTNFIKGAGADNFIRVVAVQPDGKILAGGGFSTMRGGSSPLFARLNPDGTPDPSFVSAFPSPSTGGRVYTVGLLAGGRILAAGLFSMAGGGFPTNIARLQSGGAVDPTFDAGAGPNGLVRILAVQPDGAILIGGEFTTVNHTNRNRIARLNSDGSLDTSFDPGAGANNIVRSVARLPSGQVLAGGLFTSFDNKPFSYLARLNTNGSLDSTFPAGTGPNNIVYFVAPQPDGTIMIGGDFTAVNGTNINRIARLLADGSLDASFAPDGGVLGGPVYHIIRQNDGKLVLGGGFTAVNGAPLKRIARLTSTGSVDSSFNPGQGADNEILSLALQADGKLMAGGLFVTYNGTTVGEIARIYGDAVAPALQAGLPDPAHTLVSWPAWASVYTLQATTNLQPAGWHDVTNRSTLQGDRLTVTLPLNDGPQFYRLLSR